MSSRINHSVERRYDEQSDRLFLVYYSLPPGFNSNKWGVSPTSLDTNIQTAVNKPVVVYRRNPNNRFHTHQAGNFVHPTLEEATEELGHPLKAEEYFNWQEKFAIGRVRNVDRRDKGYAFTLEITDNEAKNILKSDTYRTGIPGWTSPQIISNANLYPWEERSGLFDHWAISHIALVDVPAYGYDKASLKAKCIGEEQTCMIQTRSASQENLGFCVKQATIDLMQSVSSHVELDNTNHHTIMSTNDNGTQSPNPTGETVVTKTIPTDNNATPNNNLTTNAEQKPALSSQSDEGKSSLSPSSADNEETNKEEVKVSNLEEANTTIGQMSSLIKDLQKTVKMQGKELERINIERKQARLSYIIPRDLFKTDESHAKEVQRTMNENVSEQWLTEYWKTKRELAMIQHSKMETPMIVKSASVQVQEQHEVPDFGSSNKTNQRSVIDKQLELQKMILDSAAGGSS